MLSLIPVVPNSPPTHTHLCTPWQLISITCTLIYTLVSDQQHLNVHEAAKSESWAYERPLSTFTVLVCLQHIVTPQHSPKYKAYEPKEKAINTKHKKQMYKKCSSPPGPFWDVTDIFPFAEHYSPSKLLTLLKIIILFLFNNSFLLWYYTLIDHE